MTEHDLWRYFEQYAQMSNAWWYSVAVLPATIISGCAYFLVWLALRRTRQLPKMFLWLFVGSIPIILVLPSFYVSINLTDALARFGFVAPANDQQMSRAVALQIGEYLSQIATLGIIGASLAVVVLIAAIMIGGYAPPQISQVIQNVSQSFSKAMTRAFGAPRAERVAASSRYGMVIVTRAGAQQGTRFGITNNAIIGKIDAAMVITDEIVSRRHARFEIRNNSVFLIDLGSTNGTYIKRGGRTEELNGEPFELHHGDHIYLGDPTEPESVELRYERTPTGGQP
ncbi:MAG: FHA domain-containing protein [Roseiflexus sp.]